MIDMNPSICRVSEMKFMGGKRKRIVRLLSILNG